jgi:predicted TIM-barrel fold metal-dependent hydrolase
METVDVHQHLLGEPLIAALSRRTAAPALVRRAEGGWTFRVAGEPDSVLAPEAVDPDLRGEEMRIAGIDRALVALSSALGIESLPTDEAAPLLEAHHEGVAALPDRFGAWGAVGLYEPDPGAVDAALARGCVGISLPAAALADPAALDRVGPLLERLERADAPLFVHPGPVSAALSPEAAAALPPWWPALTDYVAQMQAAWFAFLAAGRDAHPNLRVLFAMLAGGAPLQRERYAARAGAPLPAPDPLVFYDTSSYGPRMLGGLVSAVGAEQLVYGSDRPVVAAEAEWRPGTYLGQELSSTNPGRLLASDPKGVPA